MKKFAVHVKSPNGDSVVLPKIGFGPMLLLEWLERQEEYITFMVTIYDDENLQLHFQMESFDKLSELVAYINANL